MFEDARFCELDLSNGRERIMYHQTADEIDSFRQNVRAMSKIGEGCYDKAGGFVAWVHSTQAVNDYLESEDTDFVSFALNNAIRHRALICVEGPCQYQISSE